MNRILIIGCGDIAMRVVPMLGARYRLFGLARNAARFDELRAAGITPVHGDLDDLRSLSRIAGLADTVLHFAPPASTEKSPLRAPLFAKGGIHRAGEIVCSPHFGKGGQGGFAATNTRTRNLLAALSRSAPPKHLIYISTSSVYGDCGGAHVNETHPLNAQRRARNHGWMRNGKFATGQNATG